MSSLVAIILAAAALQPGSGGGSDWERQLTPQHRRCMATGDAAEGTTAGIMSCLGLEIGRQDRRLNQTYQALIGRLPAARRTTLRNQQRQWIRTRDRTCQAESDEEGGGSLSGIIYNECIVRETVRRRVVLERYR